jgi:hypothetical protein
MIPMDELEGRFHTHAHVQVVQSAALANMNTLRVWGGGVFLPSAWYDACDEYGVMVIQDQMYVESFKLFRFFSTCFKSHCANILGMHRVDMYQKRQRHKKRKLDTTFEFCLATHP